MKGTLRDLLNIIFRFKRALVLFWIATAVAMAVYYTQTPRKYVSKARILVSLGSENQGKGNYLENKGALMQREQQIHNEQQILMSEHVLLTTAKWILGESTPEDPPPSIDRQQVLEAKRYFTGEEPEPTLLLKLLHGLSEQATQVVALVHPSHAGKSAMTSTKLAATLSKGLDAKTIFNSDALDVSFEYRDPVVAQTVLKLVLASYMDHHIAVFQSADESDLLKSEMDASRSQYQRRLDEMAAYMTTHHVFAEDSQLNSSIQQRLQINQALSDAAAESEASAARVGSFNSLNTALKRYETFSTVESRNKLHDELEKQLNAAQLQEQLILTTHPVESTVHQDQTAVVRRIRDMLATQPAQVVDQREDRRNSASQLVEQEVVRAMASLKGAQARKEALKGELNKVNQTINSYANDLPGYNMIKMNLDFSKEQSEQMGKAYVNSRLRVLTAQNEITDISVIDSPSWEPEAASPKRSTTAALAVALLLLGGIAVVIAGAGLEQTVADRRTTQAALGLPVAAVFPLVVAEDDQRPRLLSTQTESEFARIYTLVRNASKPGVVILLAGSNGGEGLSLIGYELARFLGRNTGSRTALVDCTRHAMTAPSGETGPTILTLPLKEELTSRVGGGEAGGQTSVTKMFTAWRAEFSHLVLTASTTQEMYKLVDIFPSVQATLLVVEAGRTRRATANSALDLLRSYGAQGIQLVLNKRVFFVPEWIVRRI